MSTAFIYSVNNNRIGAYLGYTRGPNIVTKPLASKMGIQVSGSPELTATLASGKEAGTDVTEAGANQRIVISLGKVNPSKYQVKVSVNPALYSIGHIQCADVVEPGDDLDLQLHISTNQKLVLAELPWLVRLYNFN